MLQAIIPAGGTKSAAVDLSNGVLAGLYCPPSLVGTNVSFLVAPSLDALFCAFTKTGYPIAVSANQYIPIPPLDFHGVRYLKIVSSATETNGATFGLAINNAL